MNYLDRRGEDLQAEIFEACDWPTEFLRDPSSWLEASKMEQLLASIDADFKLRREEDLLLSTGHEARELRAWGALDSVLRMVQEPKDLFAQPERFLSYFISPAPPVGDLKRTADSISFVLPVSEIQFPLVTAYLRAAFEALPTYIGKPLASVRWENSRVTIEWTNLQENLLSEKDASELSLHPELVQNVLRDLELAQTELEQTKKRLLDKEAELNVLKSGAGPSVAPLRSGHAADAMSSMDSALYELYRLGDYFARGQQLVTLLIAQGRQTPQVKEAMRRVDWSFVCETAPAVIKKAIDDLQTAKDDLRKEEEAPHEVPRQASLFPIVRKERLSH
ncbi:MAG TPA: hypothetical protein VM432_00855 [Bdellovibrionales bacterium]|nr:hypothetical protein [Bdellovibrionales bacterium]